MSDHFSGPAVMGDPAVDITDFYAFVSPERAGNLVLIMDVFPMATSQSFFSDVPEGTAVQKGSLVTSDGREASFVVGEAFEEDGMRIFAGLISDPFFMD